MREIQLIVVHCSDSEWGDVDVVRDWHVNKNGWSDVGYHFVITNGRKQPGPAYQHDEDGVIQTGRDIEDVGSHAKGLNRYSIGICLIGRHGFTWEQNVSLWELLSKLKTKFPNARIIGHRDVDRYGGQSGGKTCPNFNVAKWLCLMSDFA